MSFFRKQFGFTLVEMLVVVGIIAVLISITIGVASRVEDRSRIELTRSTIALVSDALAQFADYGYQYRDSSYYQTANEREFYLSLDFPPDCNGYNQVGVETELARIMNFINPQIIMFGSPEPTGQNPLVRGAGEDFTQYSGCMVMYLFLSMVPECTAILGRIDPSLVTDRDLQGRQMSIWLRHNYQPLKRIVDPWGRTLRYDYYDDYRDLPQINFVYKKSTIRTFPLITSAGPDGKFDTRDDITGGY